MVVEVPGQKGAPLRANAEGGRLSVSGVASIDASEARPDVGRNWVWGAQQLAHCSATKPLPESRSVGGLVSPPLGNDATLSFSQEASDKGIGSHPGIDNHAGCDVGSRCCPMAAGAT
jgi:hypothetical protein